MLRKVPRVIQLNQLVAEFVLSMFESQPQMRKQPPRERQLYSNLSR